MMTAIYFKGRFRWIVSGLSFLFLTSASRLIAAPSSATPTMPHYVFAHYMVCYATYGDYWPDTNSTIAGYKREIQEAQAAGVDGFALDLTAYDDPTQPYYNRRVAMIYEAAEQLNTGFKLFFSVDFNGTNEIVDVVQTYAQRTNTFIQGGKVVLSSYTGNWLPWGLIRSELATNGVNTFFIPYLLSIPVHELPTYTDAVSILSTNRWHNALDGLFLWVAAGSPAEIVQSDVGYNLASVQAGKPFMASLAPTYWGSVQTTLQRRYYETSGGEGADLEWMSVITNQPNWVEICTWNDFNESTYISPVDNPGQYLQNIASPYRYSHAGYLELYKYYINWYKSGQQAAITNDVLFYFYRTHSLYAVATNDQPVGCWDISSSDTLFNTLFLTAPATLVVSSGGNLTTNSLSAGLNQVETHFTPGAQNFTVERNGKTIISVSGPPILSNIQVYDYFTASGYAYANGLVSIWSPPPDAALFPPTNLQAIPLRQ